MANKHKELSATANVAINMLRAVHMPENKNKILSPFSIAQRLSLDQLLLFLHTYRKVASSNTSCLEAHVGFFRLLMKGIFDPYVLHCYKNDSLGHRV